MKLNTKLKWAIVVAGFCLLHVLVFTRGFYSGGPDVETYYTYASKMQQGLVPYEEFTVEYPPGALAVFLLPRLVAGSLHAYGDAFTAEMLVFDLIGLFLVLGLGRKLKLSLWSCLIGYTLVMVAISSIMVQRFDMVPAVIMLGALYAFSRGNYKTAWALLAVGTMTKLYPAALAPIFLLYQWRHQRWQTLAGSLITCAVMLLAIALPFLWIDSHGFIASFTMQSQRSLQVESTYSSILLLGHTLGLPNVQPYQGRFSYDLYAPLAQPLARYSFVVMGVAILVVYSFFLWSYRRVKDLKLSGPPDTADMGRVLNYSFVAILVLLITSKVLSPQFIVWLYPLLPLVNGRFRAAMWVVFLVIGYLTWYIYPQHYYDLLDMQHIAIDVLVLRNILLILMAVLLVGDGQTQAHREEPSDDLEPALFPAAPSAGAVS